MSEQKLREALERVAGTEDMEPCLACGSHHNLTNLEEDGDPSCYVREALLSQPTSDEGKALIDKMVDRFLSWPLPKDFMPDGGVLFKPIPNHQPIGTNLLTAEQARKMIEHMQGDR